MRQKKSTFIKSIVLFLFLMPSLASATIIFTQNFDPSLSGANGSSDFGSNNQKADNFSFSGTDQTLGAISWLGIYHGNSIPSADDFTLRIFPNNSGLPQTTGAILDLNIGSNVNRIDTLTNLGSSDLFSYKAYLPAGINLTAGTTYWLSIVNNVGSSTFDDWAWAASSTGGAAAYRSSDTQAWNSGSGTFQFELTAVPLPAGFWLMASGLLSLISFRKKEKV